MLTKDRLDKKKPGILKNKRGHATNPGKTNLFLGSLALLGGAAFSTTLGAANYLVAKITQPDEIHLVEGYNFTPYELDSDYEEVLFPTENGRLLSGWYLTHPGERRVVIVGHGHKGRKEDMLGIGTFLWKAGFNVLLFDYRGYGLDRRKGEVMTLGNLETEDYLHAIEFVANRYTEEGLPEPIIGAFGGSLGAAVALAATARDARIKAAWADSSFTSRLDVVRHNWKKATRLPIWPFLEAANLVFNSQTGFKLDDFSPLKEISQMSPRPIYFTHAICDSVTPISHVYELFEAAKGPKELWVEDGLDHCGIYFKNRQEYRHRAIAFFEKYLVEVKQSQSETAA